MYNFMSVVNRMDGCGRREIFFLLTIGKMSNCNFITLKRYKNSIMSLMEMVKNLNIT